MRVQLGRDAVADRDDGLGVVLAQAVDLAHAETQREVRAIPPPRGEGAPACVGG